MRRTVAAAALASASVLPASVHVRQILLARLLEACVVLQVVVAIGHAQRAGVVLRDHEGRIVYVGIAGHDERRRDLHAVQVANRLLQIGGRADRIDLGEQRRDRLRAEAVCLLLVHAARVEITRQLLDAATLRLHGRGLFEDPAQLILVRLAGGPAPAPATHRCRNRILGAPAAVGVREEVGARIGLAVDIADLHALQPLAVSTRAVCGGCGTRNEQHQHQVSATLDSHGNLRAADIGARMVAEKSRRLAMGGSALTAHR